MYCLQEPGVFFLELPKAPSSARRLVTWGSVEHSDQEAVRKLVDVKEVQASYDAFAAGIWRFG